MSSKTNNRPDSITESGSIDVMSSPSDSGSSNANINSSSFKTINLVSNGHTWQIRVVDVMPFNDWEALVRKHPDRNVKTAEDFVVVDEKGVGISPLTTKDQETYYISLQPSTPVQRDGAATLGCFGEWLSSLFVSSLSDVLLGTNKRKDNSFGLPSWQGGNGWLHNSSLPTSSPDTAQASSTGLPGPMLSTVHGSSSSSSSAPLLQQPTLLCKGGVRRRKINLPT
ncbi:hypothetical protein QOT17_024468 [Balamuthia mandrillaris]